MFDWKQTASICINGKEHLIKFSNFAGKIYLTYHDRILTRQLGINPAERVLDIGGGSNPFTRADVVTEPFLEENIHRSGIPIASGVQYIPCFAEKLPFKDKEFDVAISRHVFEHVKDPAKACQEMMRVAQRGFIETPSFYNSYLSDYPAHRWIVYEARGRLVFEKKRYIFNPFRNALRGYYYADADHFLAMEITFRNLACTQFYWEDSFEYEVRDWEDGFNYDDKETAAMAHLDYAINSLKYGHISLGEILLALQISLDYNPELAMAHYHQGVILNLLGKKDEAAAAFEKAAGLDHTLPLPVPGSKTKIFSLNPGGFKGHNFAGPVYPLVQGFADTILKIFNIKDPEQVIEFGEKQLIPNSTLVPPGQSAPPKKYEFSIVAGFLEKIPQPCEFLNQLASISSRGIIEVPSYMWEFFNGEPANLWLCRTEDGKLYLKRKPFTVSPFPGVISRYTDKYPEVKASFELLYRNLTYVQFLWEKDIPFQIEY